LLVVPTEQSRLSRFFDRAHNRIESLKAVCRAWAASHPNGVRGIAGVAVAFAMLTGWFIYDVVSGLPSRDELRALSDLTQGTTIYDAHGKRVFTLPTEYHVEVPLARISPNLRRAAVAVEDVRFYEHDGIDAVRVIAALLNDIRERRAAEGASTITQQLARMSFLSRDKTLRRKVKEAILAQRIERLYSKDDILEFYLNKVYFGDGLYGAEAAARGYFGKPASDLTLAEGALIAGLAKAPSASNPTVDLERAVRRRNVVLGLMRDNTLISPSEYETASKAEVVLRDTLRHEDPVGVHFKEQVRRELFEMFGKEKVYEGRLKVYTTIDPVMQAAAEEAVTASLREIEAQRPRASKARATKTSVEKPMPESGDDRLQAALLALDPATGEVRAIVGGRETDNIGLNRALQSKRQPGSAFKPFVYAAAIEQGFSPATVIDHLDDPIDTYRGAWLPEDEHSRASAMTVRTALRTSSNRAAVRMLQTVGIDRAVSQAKRLGIGAVPSVPSLALGSGEVTLQSMTSAYAAFAQGGIVREPIFIRRVEEQDGSVLFEAKRREERAVSSVTAFLMASMLADVVNTGTAARARTLGFTLPAAGKTGTTNDFVDAWFVGFTPKLVAGVWVGFDQPRTIVKNGFASLLAVPLWTRFMKVATKNDEKAWFDPPSGVVAVPVCRISGMLPVENCKHAASMSATGEITYKSMVYTEYFARGTEPTQICSAHATLSLPYPEPYATVSDVENLGRFMSVVSAPAPNPTPAALMPPAEPVGTRLPPAELPETPPIASPQMPPAAPPEPAPVSP
jgi:1A family penicillin-binding protein